MSFIIIIIIYIYIYAALFNPKPYSNSSSPYITGELGFLFEAEPELRTTLSGAKKAPKPSRNPDPWRDVMVVSGKVCV